MSHVRIACSRTEKINKDCKNALWVLLVHSTVCAEILHNTTIIQLCYSVA